MKKKAFFVLAGLLIGALLAACARSQVQTNAQASEHYNRGVENQQQGNFDLAIEEYTEAIALDPQLSDAYVNRGIVYYRQGDFYQAIADFDQAIALDPEHADAYYIRGAAYYHKGDDARAFADLERALELGLNPSKKQDAEEFLEKLRQ